MLADPLEFGKSSVCPSCHFVFTIDTEHLAQFELPEAIEIKVLDENELAISNVIIFVSYGYFLPPLRTNENGFCTLTKEMFVKSEQDEISTGLMDHKGDYSLNRYIKIQVPTQTQISDYVMRRKNSGWSLLPFEAEYFQDFNSFAEICSHSNQFITEPVTKRIDIENVNKSIQLTITVKCRNQNMAT